MKTPETSEISANPQTWSYARPSLCNERQNCEEI